MDIQKAWEKALKNTEVIRSRVQSLMTFEDTLVPYVLLSESSINVGDTVVRKGQIMVERPSLILPPNIPQFEGFDFEREKQPVDENSVVNFLFVRGINMPSMRYNNQTSSLEVYEGKLSEAIKHYNEELQREENVRVGLIVGPEDCWQFSLLIYTCSQIVRNADTDIRKLLDEYHKKGH